MTDSKRAAEIEDLQIKVAYLEQTLAQLSDEYFAQQKELQQLSLTIEALIDKLATADSQDQATEEIVDQRPPHY
ncbi:MAG: SlyX family protein [Gammaproteobacteria bacterium]|nr:SlyX family protein [Gammaproteobacteria bacterium]